MNIVEKIKEYKQSKDENILIEIINNYERLVNKYVQMYCYKHKLFHKEDMIQSCNLAIIKGIEKFDIDKNGTQENPTLYFKWQIQHAIFSYIASSVGACRIPTNLATKIKPKYDVQLLDNYSVEGFGEIDDTHLKKIDKRQLNIPMTNSMSLSAIALDLGIEGVTPIEKSIVELFCEGTPMSKISVQLNIPYQTTKNTFNSAIKKIKTIYNEQMDYYYKLGII